MNNKLSKFLSVALLATALTSCLKDKNIEEDQKYGIINLDAKKIIELSSDDSHAKTTGLAFVNRDTVLNFVAVRLAANEVASEDINVTLTTASSATLISDYNTKNGTNLVAFPSNLYTMQGGGLIVTIPKGQREAYVQIKVNPSTFDPSSTYAIGYTIASVDKPGYTISQNFKSFVAIVGAKNDYDGRYAVTGTLVDANGLYIGVYPTEIDLITVSGNQVIYYQHEIDYPNYVVEAIATGGLANTGIRPKITFDLNTDKVTSIVRNSDNAAMVVGTISKFNRADRSLDIEWTLGRWHATEHYTYLGSR
jgi:hypothetical protein